MEKAIHWFSKNHVAANFLMIAVMVAGLHTWFQLRKEVFPDTQLDAFRVSVIYPNATPEEVVEGVCVPVEEALSELNGIKTIKSTASESLGSIYLEVKTGYDVRDVMTDAKTQIDAITNFAEEAESPIIEQVEVSSQVMSVAIMAEGDEVMRRKIAEQVRDDLLDYQIEPYPSWKELIKEINEKVRPISDIKEKLLQVLQGRASLSKVQIVASRPYEVSIEIPEITLRRLGLSINQVAALIRSSSLDVPSGSLKTQQEEIVIRSKGKKYRSHEFEQIPILTKPDGTTVYLGDVAQVLDGFEDVDLESSFDGVPATLVNVYRIGEEDTLQIAQLVKAYIQKHQDQWPAGVKLEIWNDSSKLLRGRLGLLGKNIATGLLLVLIVLALFLRPSLAALVSLGIPISFMGGVFLMPWLGISINMISAFAFILVLGIVVDDAIVVGENVYSRIQKGEPPKEASWKGTHEVGVIVIFGVLTTMVAFTPMLGLSGMSGKIWPNIPLIVIPVLAFSLLQSKFVLPAHLALLRGHQDDSEARGLVWVQKRIAKGLEYFVDHMYAPILKKALLARYLVVAIFLSAFVLTLSWVTSSRVKKRFFPEVETELIQAKFSFPQGSSFVQSQVLKAQLEQAILELAEEQNSAGQPIVKHVMASAGTQPLMTSFSPQSAPQSSNLGEISVELTEAAQRSITAVEIVDRWRSKVGSVPGVETLTFTALSAAGGNAIDMSITGRDIKELREVSAFIKRELSEFQGVIDISDSDRAGKREQRITGLTALGKAEGMTLLGIAQQIRGFYYGEEVQRLQRGSDEIKVMVRLPEEERNSLRHLERMRVQTPRGNWVPLYAVAEIEEGRGAVSIQRTDRKQVINITADVNQEGNANEILKRFEEETLVELKKLYPQVTCHLEGEQEDQSNSIRELSIGFIFSLIGMYVLMAIPLRSYIQPMIIMGAVPFGIVGALWGHLLLGTEISIMSMCGVVALSGVVVNDSLVLVDYINRGVRKGKGAWEAVFLGGKARFRAIILTSLTTFVGLLPMLMETDMQAKFLIPMAISLGFGILFATGITLLLVPSLYLILADLKSFGARLKGQT